MLAKSGLAQITRRQIARQKGVTYGAVRSVHESGQLKHERQGKHGTFWFDPKAVDAIDWRPQVGKVRGTKYRRKGDAAAKAYDMFDDGESDRAIVREIKATPQDVRRLRREYAEPDEHILSVDAVAAIQHSLQACGMSTNLHQLPVAVDFLCKRSLAFVELGTSEGTKNHEQGNHEEDRHEEDRHEEGAREEGGSRGQSRGEGGEADAR